MCVRALYCDTIYIQQTESRSHFPVAPRRLRAGVLQSAAGAVRPWAHAVHARGWRRAAHEAAAPGPRGRLGSNRWGEGAVARAEIYVLAAEASQNIQFAG